MNIKTERDLKIVIQQLEAKKVCEWNLIKEEFLNLQESLKPVNIVKNAFKETVALPEIKAGVLTNVIGLATGFVAKKIVIGNTHNPIRKFLGALLERVVAGKVSRKINGVKEIPDEVQ
ncbi:MAG TPA: hypothetical protein VK808_11540 [Bacteroidia bacterium]|jgi:hypothetical protein|nr:hypothetical protein [Bacteroidia bacterium]